MNGVALHRRTRLRWLMIMALGLALVVAARGPAGAETSRLAPARGMLLVAKDGMTDPRFRRTVILILHYDAAGVAGLILNRPLGKADEGNLKPPDGVPTEMENLFVGGPLQREPLVLVRSDQPPEPSSKILPGLFLTGIPELRKELSGDGLKKEDYRIFLGYAGWKPAQLAAEIARGSWDILPADPGTVLTGDPATLWRRLSGERSWI